jgi:hypothetical protein
MKSIATRNSSPSYFLIIGIIGLLGAIIGFMGTFFIPVSLGTFEAPFAIYLHGAFAFSWIILFVLQTSFIHLRNIKTHIIAGFFGIGIALGTVITMLPVAIYATDKELAQGFGDIAYIQTTGTLTSGAIFFILVSLGFFYRKKPAIHKRFMLLATILVLWPAWFRFRHYFPEVPRPDIWFGIVLSDSLIILSWIFDYGNHRKIHPVLLYGGILIIMENFFELLVFETTLWQEIGKAIYLALK